MTKNEGVKEMRESIEKVVLELEYLRWFYVMLKVDGQLMRDLNDKYHLSIPEGYREE